MKTIYITALIAISLLSGCNNSSESSSNLEKAPIEQNEQVQVLSKTETSLIVNTSKSPTILVENQVKTNVAYTHFSVSGARYQ